MKTRFKECRKDANLSQKEVASALKVSVQAVSYWENGSRMPSHENCVALANLYNVSLDVLLGVEENQQQSAITFPGTVKPADVLYERALDMAKIKADIGHAESAIQLENRYQMLQAIQSELQTLNDDRLKQALEYAQFLKKLESK